MNLLDELEARSVPGPRGCRIWVRATARGYGVLQIKRHQVLAHRVAWELAFGPIPAGLFVLHACDERRCVNPNHLMLGTHTANVVDMISKRRNIMSVDPKRVMAARLAAGFAGNRRGSAHGRSKLTEPIVLEMRRRHAAGESAAALGREFGVSNVSAISAISGRTWKTVA